MRTILSFALLLQDDFGDAAGSAAALGMGVFTTLVFLVLFAVFVIGMWKVYTKAGKPGWACLIPIYNVIVLLEIVGRPIWWVVLCCIPLVNFVVLLVVLADLAKSFGQGPIFVLWFLLGGLGYLLLGFGQYRYVGPAAAGSQHSPRPTTA